MRDRDPVSLLPKGASFTRAVIASALHVKDPQSAERYGAARWGENSAPARFLKTAVTAGSMGGATWGDELAPDSRAAAVEFFEAFKPQTVIGKLPGLRRVPRGVKLVNATGSARATWVGQGKAKPIGSLTFGEAPLDGLRLTSTVVVTRELLANATPEAEELIRRDLVRAAAETMDETFIGVDAAGVPDVSPASITYGVTPTHSAGDFATDLRALIDDFQGDLTQAVLIGSPRMWATVAGIEYPDVSIRGIGEVAGIPQLSSAALAGDSGGEFLVMVDPSRIALIEGGAGVTVAKEATIEMSDEPTGDATAPTATTLVSLWQTGCVAISVELFVNWKAQTGAVAVVDDVDYAAGS
jgi:hypothetical protein